MKKKKFLIISVLVLGTPIFFLYLTFVNSKDCNQLVIDTYEIYSGINIPKVDYMNCYYDQQSKTRIAVYDLNSNIDQSKFELSNSDALTKLLQGMNLLTDIERPKSVDLYIAAGKKWGVEWTYVVDPYSNRLWTELNY